MCIAMFLQVNVYKCIQTNSSIILEKYILDVEYNVSAQPSWLAGFNDTLQLQQLFTLFVDVSCLHYCMGPWLQ